MIPATTTMIMMMIASVIGSGVADNRKNHSVDFEQRQRLAEKYRDRAKERREGKKSNNNKMPNDDDDDNVLR